MSNIDWKAVSRHEGPWVSSGFKLWHQFMIWQKRLNIVLKPHGLTQPRFSILAAIGWMTKDHQTINQQDVADFTSMDRMHISQIVRALARDGLIERAASSEDRRSIDLSLSVEGAQKLAICLPLVEEEDTQFFNEFP